MTDMEHRPGTFVIDKAYLRQEARAGLASFFAPLSGVYHAIVGQDAAPKGAKIRKPTRKPRYGKVKAKRMARKRA